ncbi:DUF1330 domain-containing protein [Flavobacterium sp. 5]|uniref:DUF1330 domain-containing protein n=1 Tax=Flavobacterium sp. 5 TaxID=2035199 RepID=UPI000C2CCA8A|nr:DUF1330 domain-containing protein [Flavobacterium sp. 5]PKB17184.1 hypothetical protein CLU82_2366 [Flavobacterium sp. 5]
MIFITQFIYVIEGQEAVFNEFESLAIPIIAKYNGQLLMRIRPEESNFIECTIEKPYEIHLVSFATDEDFENFKQDEERKLFLHLKEKSIQSILFLKGIKL